MTVAAPALLVRPARVQVAREQVDTPWPWTAVLLAAGAAALAVVLLVAAWVGASRQADPVDQVAWLNLGMLAVCVLGSGCALWLLVGRRSVSVRASAVRHELGQALRLGAVAGPPAVPVAAAGGLVTAPGLTRHHVPACPLVAGRVTNPAPAGLAGCEVCGA